MNSVLFQTTKLVDVGTPENTQAWVFFTRTFDHTCVVADLQIKNVHM